MEELNITKGMTGERGYSDKEMEMGGNLDMVNQMRQRAELIKHKKNKKMLGSHVIDSC